MAKPSHPVKIFRGFILFLVASFLYLGVCYFGGRMYETYGVSMISNPFTPKTPEIPENATGLVEAHTVQAQPHISSIIWNVGLKIPIVNIVIPVPRVIPGVIDLTWIHRFAIWIIFWLSMFASYRASREEKVKPEKKVKEKVKKKVKIEKPVERKRIRRKEEKSIGKRIKKPKPLSKEEFERIYNKTKGKVN